MKIMYVFAIVFALVLICPIAIATPALPVSLVSADFDLGAALVVLVLNAEASVIQARQTADFTDCTCLTCPYMRSSQVKGYWRIL